MGGKFIKWIKWIKAHLYHLIATFQVVMTFRSETNNNHLTNIRLTALTEEAESLNEKYSFWINLQRRCPPCGKIAVRIANFKSTSEIILLVLKEID